MASHAVVLEEEDDSPVRAKGGKQTRAARGAEVCTHAVTALKQPRCVKGYIDCCSHCSSLFCSVCPGLASRRGR